MWGGKDGVNDSARILGCSFLRHPTGWLPGAIAAAANQKHFSCHKEKAGQCPAFSHFGSDQHKGGVEVVQVPLLAQFMTAPLTVGVRM